MRVSQLWRYPVKSMLGEALDHAAIDGNGLHGDRSWGVRDDATGRVLTGRREPRLLNARATLVGDQPEVHLPTGPVCAGTGPATDAALTTWLGTKVGLVAAASEPSARAEFFADPTDDASEALEWTMPAGRFVDAASLLVLTTASLAAAAASYPAGDWDVRRFRPNIVIDTGDGTSGWFEDEWCGRSLRIGAVELAPEQPCARCTMVTRPQDGLDRDLDVYRTLARHHGGTFGVWTAVAVPGTIQVGDPVTIA